MDYAEAEKWCDRYLLKDTHIYNPQAITELMDSGAFQSTWELDEKAVTEGLERIHNETSSILKYNNENSLTCTILMAYYSAKSYYMNPVLKLPSGKGFADAVYIPKRETDRPALVVELKWKQSAKGAIA